MKVTLVLATVGRTDDVGRLVQSLATQTLRAFELNIVDQNADERLQPFIAQARRAGIDVTHLRMNMPSLSLARNLGIAQASGDVIAFPDDDCWYEPQVIENVLAAFAVHPTWSGVVAEWVEQAQAHRGQPVEQLLSHSKWRRYRDGDASSISLFIKADLLRQLGGFDARLGVGQWFGAGEETDLILTALAAGALIGRCPEARIHHAFDTRGQRQSASAWRAAMRRARGTGALYVKHRISLGVIARGLVAPPLKVLWPWQGATALVLGLATSVGRIQGALKWLFTER